jgi:hypothetical protein
MNNPLGIITSRIEVMLLDTEELNVPAQVLEDLVLHRRPSGSLASPPTFDPSRVRRLASTRRST